MGLKNKLYAKRLTVIPSHAVESHVEHGIFQTIYFNPGSPLVDESLSLKLFPSNSTD